MFKFFYLFSFIISFICLVILLIFQKNRRSYVIPLVFVAVLVANFGYLSGILAQNEADAILAVKITYLGECFLQLLLAEAIADFCNVKVPKWLMFLLFITATFVYACVLSIGYAPVYYKSVELHSIWGLSFITKEYGIFHNLYLGLVFFAFGFQISIIIRSFFNKKSVSYKTNMAILAFELVSLLTYIAENVMNLPVDLIPFSYCFCEIVFLILLNRYNKYALSDNISTHIRVSDALGFACFDRKLNFVGCNDVAKAFVPELELCKIDENVPVKLETLHQMIIAPISELLESEKNESEFSFSYGERYFRATASKMFRLNHCYGVILKLEDDTERQKYVQLLDNYNKELLVAVTEKSGKIQDMQKKMIYSVAEIIEERDEITGDHIKRTSAGVRILAEEMAKYPDLYFVPENFFELTVEAAPLHDLGKIVVDDAILRKKGKLTDEEFTIIKMHPLKGAEIVEKVLRGLEEDDFVDTAKNIALYHHERWDGRGYPVGLSGEQIPLEARMMALADVTDALLSKRSYKDAMSYDQTFQILEESMGTQFDPELGKLFLNCRDRIVEYYEAQKQSN